MMTCGYVESNMTSWLLYGCRFQGNPGYDSMEEAIKDLALDLYAKFYDEHLSAYENRYLNFERCCRDVLIEDPKANFCKGCGKAIANKQFDPAEFRDFVVGLHNTTCDSYGDAEWTSTRERMAWWPWSIREFIHAPKDSVIYIAENGEHILLEALYEAKPELKGAEDDYQNYASPDWDAFKAGKQPSYS